MWRGLAIAPRFRLVVAVALVAGSATLGAALHTASAVAAPSTAPSTAPGTASTPTTIQVDLDFSWDGVRNCENQRAGSVICISAQATVPGLGLVEYARDAVPNGQHTSDGCPEFSTHGQLWVPGGTAQFDGVPVPTCGANDNPDAHYTYTLTDGDGVLAGATGTGDVVADNGVDRWHGTIRLAVTSAAPTAATATPAARKSPISTVVFACALAALVLAGGVGLFVVRARRVARRGGPVAG